MEKVIDEMRSEQKKNKWIIGLIEDRKAIGVRGANISNKEISEKVKKWDTEKWTRELQEKQSLSVYREWRKEIGGQDKVYDNSEASKLLFKCRSNNTNLYDINRVQNKSTECVMCEMNEIENLNHFLLQCPAYSEERNKNPVLQRPYIENEEQIIGNFLYNNRIIEQSKSTIYKIWQIRKKKIQ